MRGVALGLALIMYGQEEGADTLIEQMTRDQDPIPAVRAHALPDLAPPLLQHPVGRCGALLSAASGANMHLRGAAPVHACRHELHCDLAATALGIALTEWSYRAL